MGVCSLTRSSTRYARLTFKTWIIIFVIVHRFKNPSDWTGLKIKTLNIKESREKKLFWLWKHLIVSNPWTEKRSLMLFLVIVFDGTIFRIDSFYYKITSFNWVTFHSISKLILISAKGGSNDWFRRTLSSLTGLHETCSL